MANGMAVIEWLAREKKLFRERDVRAQNASTGLFEDALAWGIATPHGHGVWSHPNYVPTRYEVLQIRFKRAVFWGPSALWLLGALNAEPEELWVAIGNSSRPPRAIDLSTIVVRARNLERDVVKLKSAGRVQELRVHSLERAARDTARTDCPGLLARSIQRRDFELAPDAELLSAQLRAWRTCVPYPEPPEDRRNDPEFDCRVKCPDTWSIARALPPAQESRGRTR